MGLCFSFPRRHHPMMGPAMVSHPRPVYGVSYGMPMGGMGGMGRMGRMGGMGGMGSMGMGGMGCGPPRYGRAGRGYGGGRYRY
ncbi:hypothetical protein BJX70DRAFT_371015 [Aspergillus crustosus]